MTRKVLVAIAAVALVPQAAFTAAYSLADRILACAEENDDTRRLACYDREAGALPDAGKNLSDETAAAPGEIAETAAEAPSASAPADEFGKPPERNGSKPEAEMADSPPSASEALDDFGMTPELARSKPGAVQENKLRQISAKVVKVSKRPGGELVITLDNGQTWTEKYAEYGFRIRVGDTVVIKKGSFSTAYRMVGPGRRSSQVRRIE